MDVLHTICDYLLIELEVCVMYAHIYGVSNCQYHKIKEGWTLVGLEEWEDMMGT